MKYQELLDSIKRDEQNRLATETPEGVDVPTVTKQDAVRILDERIERFKADVAERGLEAACAAEPVIAKHLMYRMPGGDRRTAYGRALKARHSRVSAA